MAIKEAKYSRTFISQTDKIDSSIPRNATWEDYQELSKEDLEIRREIEKKFKFRSDGDRYEGFDGKILYLYSITNNLISSDGSKNIEYQTEVSIKKAGAENDISFPSDLERFLMKKKFKQLK
ncbi:Uncharacterised protein [uncultured archaeon]|nr:Uncharacterised protein [uncultured archaeon]